MRIVLTILLILVVLLPSFGCGTGKPMAMQTNSDATPGYEIIIRFFEFGNAMDKVMDVFSKNGLMISKMQQTYLFSERQELRISIKNGCNRQLSDAEYELRNVINVESISIRRL